MNIWIYLSTLFILLDFQFISSDGACTHHSSRESEGINIFEVKISECDTHSKWYISSKKPFSVKIRRSQYGKFEFDFGSKKNDALRLMGNFHFKDGAITMVPDIGTSKHNAVLFYNSDINTQFSLPSEERNKENSFSLPLSLGKLSYQDPLGIKRKIDRETLVLASCSIIDNGIEREGNKVEIKVNSCNEAAEFYFERTFPLSITLLNYRVGEEDRLIMVVFPADEQQFVISNIDGDDTLIPEEVAELLKFDFKSEQLDVLIFKQNENLDRPKRMKLDFSSLFYPKKDSLANFPFPTDGLFRSPYTKFKDENANMRCKIKEFSPGGRSGPAYFVFELRCGTVPYEKLLQFGTHDNIKFVLRKGKSTLTVEFDEADSTTGCFGRRRTRAEIFADDAFYEAYKRKLKRLGRGFGKRNLVAFFTLNKLSSYRRKYGFSVTDLYGRNAFTLQYKKVIVDKLRNERVTDGGSSERSN